MNFPPDRPRFRYLRHPRRCCSCSPCSSPWSSASNTTSISYQRRPCPPARASGASSGAIPPPGSGASPTRFSLLGILLVHEMGHFFACRRPSPRGHPALFHPRPDPDRHLRRLHQDPLALLLEEVPVRRRPGRAAGRLPGRLAGHRHGHLALAGRGPGGAGHGADPGRTAGLQAAQPPAAGRDARRSATCWSTPWRSPAGSACWPPPSTSFPSASWTAATSSTPCSAGRRIYAGIAVDRHPGRAGDLFLAGLAAAGR